MRDTNRELDPLYGAVALISDASLSGAVPLLAVAAAAGSVVCRSGQSARPS